MTEPPRQPDADAVGDAGPTPPPEPAQKKSKDKVRSAWISFFGRVIAQVVGAVATIVLTVLFLQRAQAPREAERAPDAATAPVPRTRASRSEPALAVLPLRNLSGDPRQEYFADGMTEAIITNLATVPGLRVISATSSMAFKGHQKALPEIARELGVDLIVEGSVTRSGEQVRVTAQLIEARSDEHLWAETYDRTIRDVLVLQGQVAEAIVDKIAGVVRSSPRTRLAATKPVDPAVYDLYLRGRSAWNLRTPAGFDEAIRYFEQAIAAAPDFALAYAGLADANQLRSVEGDDPAKALLAAEQALKLDESLGEVHTSLAGVLHRSRADISSAEREFKRALELNPGYATAHQWYAILLAEEGRDAEARDHAERAVLLDPLSPPMHQTLGLVNYYGRRFTEAAAASRRALELAPYLTLARDVLARSLLAQGLAAETLKVWSEQTPASPDALATLALACRMGGQPDRAESISKELLARQPAPDGALARWYAGVGNADAAFERLRRLASRGPGGLQQLRADPQLDGLRSDPRFTSLIPPRG